MKGLKLFLLLILLTITNVNANPEHASMGRPRTDANVVGHIVADGKHLPFVTITLKGSTIGTVADETGHFRLIHLPVGQHTLVASFVGYKPKEITIISEEKKTLEVNFYLEYDALGLEEIVVTGDRNERRRSESPVIVNSLGPNMFNKTNSVSFGEALNFAPGLRLENNCQNCGFTQVRMNGMEGTYSQILINSRPVFTGLAGVYGLELIPANMIERIEVVRGGGSAIYGSNAIAGTINVILKDPLINSYEAGINTGVSGVGMTNSGGLSPDNHINFNASMVTADHNTGLSVFGFNRTRAPFDANGDEFSEVTRLNNTTLGARLFHRIDMRSKISADFFNIREERRGGNDFDKLPHLAAVSETANHNITTGVINFTRFYRSTDVLSVFSSGQIIKRDTYYGAEQSLSDYGVTDNYTYNGGFQYKALIGKSILTAGAEFTGETLLDTKQGYPSHYKNNDGKKELISGSDNTIIADQLMQTAGVFTQYDVTIRKAMLSLGGRFDHYKVEDREKGFEPKKGNMFSPRVNLLYNIIPGMQARLSYSQGYRAPQIFDEDLHIETSGARKVIHQNEPDLKAETSRSYMASLDYNRLFGKTSASILVEGFYTVLSNPFVLGFGTPDDNGEVVYTRGNAEGNALVRGINTEINIIPSRKISINSGITLQRADYDEEQEFGETRFFRSPNTYGFINTDYTFSEHWSASLNGSYTGKMLIPYFGPELENPEDGELRLSKEFFDMGARLGYNTRFHSSGLQIFAGVKNIFNSYQKDFDYGDTRDPGYMYGPMLPRTIYFGIRIGNMLK
jgi:outer membrane receptor for ferrienterochelin and colicins